VSWDLVGLEKFRRPITMTYLMLRNTILCRPEARPVGQENECYMTIQLYIISP